MFARSMLPMVVAAFLALLLTAPAHAADFEGPVISTGDDQLVLSLDGEQHTFVVDDDTKITLNGKRAALADILPDHLATISAERDGDQWIARTIVAHVPK